MKTSMKAGLGLAMALAGIAPASAHITFGSGDARAGGSYRAVLRVPHGCEGAATTAVRIQIPEGVITVKPMPKPGWDLEVVTGPYERAYTRFGSEVRDGVKEIRWTGGDLPDAFYDEFVFTGTFAESLPVNERLYFPVVQECGNAVDRWIEIPGAGPEPEHPAPGILVLPAN